MNSRSVRFILFVQETPGQTVSDLAQYFKVSKRTIFSWIFLANSSLEGSAIIHAVKGKYEVRVIDAERFSKLTNSFVDKYGISDSSRKRISDLLHNLLIRTDWITIDSLSQIFYVSRVSISNDLKKVEQILAPYKLSLLRRPRYGIRIDGSEINRRICLASLIQKGLNSEKVVEDDFVSVQEISEIIEEILKKEKFQLSLIGYQNLLVHLAIALSRIKKDCYVPMEPKYLATIENSKEYRVSQCIARNIQQSYGIELPKEEIAYIAIHLAGKQIVSEFAEENESSLVVTDEIWNIVNQIVEHISNVYKFDFTDDIELRMNLARHIAPLLVRLQYQMHAENPLLLDIKTRFPLAFSMAQETVGILMSISGTQPSEDEIGYLALSFALALERKKVDAPKKNILIVCATGSGSARLLEYKYRAQFANQIGTIRTCDVLQVSLQDFTNIDYVFTTVPLRVSVPVPVRVVSNFLNDEDIKVINRIFLIKATK